MPSPFPGMDPFLEQPYAWHDFEMSFGPAAAEQLVPQVRPKHIVRLLRRGALSYSEGRLSFIQIEERLNREPVTVISLISTADKFSDEQRQSYLAERERILSSPQHFIEIDLLRGGRRTPIDHQPDCDYCVMVSRAKLRPRVELWPFRLRDRLPFIPIPLCATDPDAVLDLQAVLNHIYDAARYEDYIYTGTPVPALSTGDRTWADEFLSRIRQEKTPPDR